MQENNRQVLFYNSRGRRNGRIEIPNIREVAPLFIHTPHHVKKRLNKGSVGPLTLPVSLTSLISASGILKYVMRIKRREKTGKR